jgi:DNA-binding HxlR family transcriptional regulator
MAFKQTRTLSRGPSGVPAPDRLTSDGEVRATRGPSPEVAPIDRRSANSSRGAWKFSAEDHDYAGRFGSREVPTDEGETARPGRIPNSVGNGNCPVVREILSRVGDKWSARILALLTEAPQRFSEIRKAVPQISPRMLSHTLRGLERDGVLVRAVYPTIPPKVEYTLSPSGRSLLAILDELANWARTNQQEIERAREAVRRREEAYGPPMGPWEQDPRTWARPRSAGSNPPRNVASQAARPVGGAGRGTGQGRI